MASLSSQCAESWRPLRHQGSSKSQRKGSSSNAPNNAGTPKNPSKESKSPSSKSGVPQDTKSTARQDSTKSTARQDSVTSTGRRDSTKGKARQDSVTSTGRQDSSKDMTRQDSTKSSKSRTRSFWLSDEEQSRLKRRVEEMELWKPENDFFKENEYWRRRDSKRQQMKTLEGDKRLVRWKKLYIPAFVGLAVGLSLSLTCSIKGLGEGTFLWSHRWAFQVTGFTVLCVGLLLLLLAAGATYYVEERLRREMGLPPMFVIQGQQRVEADKEAKEGQQGTTAEKNVPVPRNRAQGLHSLSNNCGETSAFLEASLSLPAQGEASTWPPVAQGTSTPAPGPRTDGGRLLRQKLRADLTGQRSMSVESENSSGYSTGLSDSGRGGGDSSGHPFRLAPFASAIFSRSGFQRLTEPDVTPPVQRGKGEFGLSTFASCAPCRIRDCCLSGSLWSAPHPGSAVRCSPYNLRFGPRDSSDPKGQVSKPSICVTDEDHDAAGTSATASDFVGNVFNVTASVLPDVTRGGEHAAASEVSEVSRDEGQHDRNTFVVTDSVRQSRNAWQCFEEDREDKQAAHSSPFRVGRADIVIHATSEDYV